MKRQLEEADRILLNKADTLSDAQIQEELALLKQNFAAPAMVVSALKGDASTPGSTRSSRAESPARI